MTKVKQCSTEFDVPCSRENNPWIGKEQCLASRGAFFPKDLGKREFCRALEEAFREQRGLTGEEVAKFLKALRSYFLGQGNWLKLSWGTVIGVCEVSLTGISHKCRLT